MSGVDVTKYEGMTEDAATVLAYNDGWARVRILSRDGNHYVVTRDARDDRVNFDVVDTLVTRAKVG